MKRWTSWLAVVMMVVTSAAIAEEAGKKNAAKEGLKKGDPLGAFHVTKCAGAESDQVPIGENLCYRCKNGARPQVIVFTRSTDPVVVKLAKRLDSAVREHEDAQLRAFVCVLGDSKEKAEAEAKKLAAEARVELIPFVVPNDVATGPQNYSLDPNAAITVVLGNENKVVATYSVEKPEELKIARVLKMAEKMLQ